MGSRWTTGPTSSASASCCTRCSREVRPSRARVPPTCSSACCTRSPTPCWAPCPGCLPRWTTRSAVRSASVPTIGTSRRETCGWTSSTHCGRAADAAGRGVGESLPSARSIQDDVPTMQDSAPGLQGGAPTSDTGAASSHTPAPAAIDVGPPSPAGAAPTRWTVAALATLAAVVAVAGYGFLVSRSGQEPARDGASANRDLDGPRDADRPPGACGTRADGPAGRRTWGALGVDPGDRSWVMPRGVRSSTWGACRAMPRATRMNGRSAVSR